MPIVTVRPADIEDFDGHDLEWPVFTICYGPSGAMSHGMTRQTM